MPYPRPILKRFGTSSDDSDSPNSREGGISRVSARPNKVHFPNHPDALARTHVVFSPDVYDRSPIEIRPNICALPERGCPGLTYSDESPQDDMDVDDDETGSRTTRRLRRGDHRHPCARVVGFLKSGDVNDLSTRPIVYDISDASSDSDNNYSTPFSGNTSCSSASRSQQFSSSAPSFPSSAPRSPHLSPKSDPAQLAFLPHPHSYSHVDERSSSSFHPSGSSIRDSRSARRLPSSPTRQRQRSRSRVRGSPIRDRRGPGNKQEAYGDREDEGCLGGF